MDEEKFLKATSILKDLDEAELAQVLKIARPIQVPRGKAILREGEAGDTMYILREGEVEVSKTMVMRPGGMENPSRDKILSKISAKDHAIFGEVGLFEQNKRTATVMALTDCSLLEIGKADFLRLAEENPRLGYKITRNIAELLCSRLRKSGEDMVKLTTALSIALSR
jgi:CRP/FNR family transcriptional regulator, cyclic AMP receptor protein